jgi:hypothetical protein
MNSPSSKLTELEYEAESDATSALREILGVAMNEDLFKPGEAVGVIGALAERALQRFEEVSLRSRISSSEEVCQLVHPRLPFVPLLR